MFTARQATTQNALLSTVGVLVFLATAGQQVRAADSLLSTSPSPSDLPPITQAANDSTGEPRALPMHHKPCNDEHANFCANGGTCMYPQDMEKPSCWCKPSYGGQRCMLMLAKTTKAVEYKEVVVGLSVALVLFVLILAVLLWWLRKRCIKQSPQKYGGPETSV
ncbi:hypothetical protein CRUP_036342 [Coryphaenoides rupestris]|nr:hypothetical protein CRUP_036342 [Coryphaenoides rupestris]